MLRWIENIAVLMIAAAVTVAIMFSNFVFGLILAVVGVLATVAAIFVVLTSWIYHNIQQSLKPKPKK